MIASKTDNPAKPKKGERHFRLIHLFMNNQNPNRPPKKQMAPRDMMIVALIVLGITRLDFGNLNSFHVLLLFLMGLMLMLRWGNMRKEAVRKQSMQRYKDQYDTGFTPDPSAGPQPVWADAPAEPVKDAPADSEEISATETAEEEKTEE